MINSYRELSIAKYEEIQKIFEQDIDAYDKQIGLIACLADMDVEEVYNLPISKCQALAQNTAFLYDLPKPKSSIPNKITIAGQKYTILKAVDKMSAGQYIDLQNYIKNQMGVSWILTTILIPDGHKYDDGYDIAELERVIYNNFNIEDAGSIAFFLRRKLQTTINASLLYLDWTLKRMEKKMNPEQKKEVEEARKKLRALKVNGNGSIW